MIEASLWYYYKGYKFPRLSTQVGIIFVVDVSDQSVGLAKQDERVRVYVATVLPEIVTHTN